MLVDTHISFCPSLHREDQLGRPVVDSAMVSNSKVCKAAEIFPRAQPCRHAGYDPLGSEGASISNLTTSTSSVSASTKTSSPVS